MPDSVYRVTEVIGTSTDSWEAAARNAVETAARTPCVICGWPKSKSSTLRSRTARSLPTEEPRVSISFKYETGE